jgi:ubiquinone/menaquinone biosynthesis C-methylase UbiE
MRGVRTNEDWEREALNWIAWAHTPGHDVYWRYREAFFELVPFPWLSTLEIGCGEGRVARDLAARGHQITGVDAAPTLLEAVREEGGAGEYLLADAAALPLADGSFDLVVAYNSLMDIQDMPGAVREASRVLVQGGRFCVCVTHPVSDAGQFASCDPNGGVRDRRLLFPSPTLRGHLRARRIDDDLLRLVVSALQPRSRFD